MRKVTRTLSLLGILWMAPLLETVGAPRNVLFIAVDDMNDWVGHLGGYPGKTHTPHIDRLADMGTAFTNAHTVVPVCCPSRAAVMSGLYPSTSGVYNNAQWWKPHRPGMKTLPVLFRENGYTASGSGKIFHHTVGNNPPAQWDEFRRLIFNDNPWARSTPRARPLYPYTPHADYPENFPFGGIVNYSDEVDWGVLAKPEAEYDDAVSVDFAIEFLARDHDKPWFLACGLFHPHLPWYIPQKYLDLYPLEEVFVPDSDLEDLDDIPEAGKKLALKKADNLKKIVDAGQWKTAIRHYLASISFADAQIGRLLDAFDKFPGRDNTIIVLWSDHGWHLGEKGHWHKRTLWEESTRVPFIIVAPGAGQPGQRCARAVSLIDIYPTLVELCGLPAVEGRDGESLVPLLRDPTSKRQRPAVIQHEDRHVAVRSDRYRYIRYKDGSEELYDHESDPAERKNLAGKARLEAEKKRLASWIPTEWAPSAPSKGAYEFDPHAYTWKHKKTGVVTNGSEE